MEDHSRAALLSVKEASKLLGVSEPTLRHWTDQGVVRAFITPGGHRRYAEADLVNLVRRKHERKRPGQIVATMKEVAPQQHRLVEEYLLSTRWYPGLEENARQQFRERGSRLLQLIIRFVTHPSSQEQAYQEAGAIGREYGLQLSGLSLSLSEAIETFLLHRAPLIDAASQLIRSRGALSRRTQEALLQVSNLTDRVLLALMEAFQESEKTKLHMEVKGKA